MLPHKKKLVTAVANWIEGGKDDTSNWNFEDDTVRTIPTNAVIAMWEHYKNSGGLPEPGGWSDQPLDILVQIYAVQLVYSTFQYKRQKDADWSNFNETQLEIIRQVEKEALGG